MRNYDLVIIGCGASGFAATIKASEVSGGRASIAMVCKGPLGGTCVNVGCVPSKYLIEVSNRYFYSKRETKGVKLSAEVDFGTLMDGLREVVGELRREKYEDVLGYYPNVELVRGSASFAGPSRVRVKTEDGELELTGSRFIIGVGSRPSVPPIRGLGEVSYLTSDSVWELRELPRSLVVIGGGAIGLEIGQALAHLGSEVTIVEAMDRVIPVPRVETEVSTALAEYLEGEGLRVLVNSTVAEVKPEGRRKVVVVQRRGEVEKLKAEEVLVATGRRPNTDELGLDRAGVKSDRRGYVIVDEHMRTSNPRIYAAGDCAAKELMLETLAAREGVVAAVNALTGDRESVDYWGTPLVVFTTPQVASVGLTEEELMRREGVCSCRTLKLDYVAKARLIGDTRGLVKLVVDPKDKAVVGVHMLSPYASEVIMEGAIAVKRRMTLEELVNTTHVFPTVAEAIKIAGQSFIRDPSRMSCCME